MPAEIIKAPKVPPIRLGGARKSVFLAGSIEMGKAEDWQTRLTNELLELDINIFNPRRDDWDSSWVQSIHNPQFEQQVSWELNRLEEATVIAMYFDPRTMSPISLLELGLYARGSAVPGGKYGKLIVLCPEGFWRKGNVDIVCCYYDIAQVSSFEELVQGVKERLT